jgi:hypothetical protein
MQHDEQSDKAFLKHLGQHLVAICGSYVQSAAKGQSQFYSYTGTVFEIQGRWCIATAGHCLRQLEEATSSPQLRVESQVLADCFGPNATNNMPLPFKPLEEGFLYVDEDGLDFGLILISDLWKQNLERNGIIPFTSKQWHFPTTQGFEGYAIVGFPDEYTGTVVSNEQEPLIGHVKPCYVPIARLPNDTSNSFPRFMGQILDKGNQQSIVGMSGGPIFGFFREGGQVKYLLLALQSTWDKRSTVFGCLIPAMIKCLEQKVRDYLDSSRLRSSTE